MSTSTTAASSNNTLIQSPPSYKYHAKPHPADKMLDSHCAQPQPGKGFLQPHRSHLPRRRKLAPPKLTLEPPVLVSVSVSVSVPFPVSAVTATPPPRNPLPPTPTPSLGPSPQINTSTTHHGPLQPHISHLPRRRRLHTRHYHALAPARRKAKMERDMCLQRVAAGVWVGFSPDQREPSSSEDDDFGGGEGKNDWDVGLEERFTRIVRIASITTEVSPAFASTSSLTLAVEGEGVDDHGVTLLTDAQIQQACVFLHSTSTTSPSSTHPRYSSFPAPSSPRKTKPQFLILTPRSRAVDALSLAAAYVVGRGQVLGTNPATPPSTPLTPPLSPPPSMATPNTAPLRFPAQHNKTNSEEEEEGCEPIPSPPSSNPSPDPGAGLNDALRSDLTHPIAEWSACVVPSRALQLDEDEEEEGYTPVHELLMTLHDLAVEERKAGDPDERAEEHKEEKEDGEGGLRDEWRGVVSGDGMRRVWGVWSSSGE